jgi:uncharacterized protein
MKRPKVCFQVEATKLAKLAETGTHDVVRKILSSLDKELINAALRLSAHAGYIRAAVHLLDHGADIEAGHHETGTTPLMLAVEKGHAQLVELLLARGAAVQVQGTLGWTALMRASSEGHTDVVKVLVKRGADITYKAPDGETALGLALWRGHTEVEKVLTGH